MPKPTANIGPRLKAVEAHDEDDARVLYNHGEAIMALATVLKQFKPELLDEVAAIIRDQKARNR